MFHFSYVEGLSSRVARGPMLPQHHLLVPGRMVPPTQPPASPPGCLLGPPGGNTAGRQGVVAGKAGRNHRPEWLTQLPSLAGPVQGDCFQYYKMGIIILFERNT